MIERNEETRTPDLYRVLNDSVLDSGFSCVVKMTSGFG
jgi:hypothetical protein